MSKAPEQEIADALAANKTLVKEVGPVVLSEPPRPMRPPFVVCSLIGDANGRRFFTGYSGEMLLQFDLYGKSYEAAGGRAALKKALRSLRGTVGELRGVWVVVTNEISLGLVETGMFRWTVDATVYWEENNASSE